MVAAVELAAESLLSLSLSPSSSRRLPPLTGGPAASSFCWRRDRRASADDEPHCGGLSLSAPLPPWPAGRTGEADDASCPESAALISEASHAAASSSSSDC